MGFKGFVLRRLQCQDAKVPDNPESLIPPPLLQHPTWEDPPPRHARALLAFRDLDLQTCDKDFFIRGLGFSSFRALPATGPGNLETPAHTKPKPQWSIGFLSCAAGLLAPGQIFLWHWVSGLGYLGGGRDSDTGCTSKAFLSHMHQVKP